MPDNPLYRHPSMKLLCAAIARDSRQQLIAAIFLTISGFSATYFAFQKSHIIAALGIIATIIGIRLTFKFLQKQNVEESYLVHLLFYQPEKIVWVYGIITEHQPFGFNTTQGGVLYFHLIDGDNISVSLSPQRLKQISKFLNRLLPNTLFGHTKERAIQYAQDPASLRQSE